MDITEDEQEMKRKLGRAKLVLEAEVELEEVKEWAKGQQKLREAKLEKQELNDIRAEVELEAELKTKLKGMTDLTIQKGNSFDVCKTRMIP